MRLELVCENWTDAVGCPTGGVAFGPGFAISWQHGPLGRGAERKEPNGAFVESIIWAAKQRIEFYQSTRFHCEENAEALRHLNDALQQLQARTRRREEAGTEGTCQGT